VLKDLISKVSLQKKKNNKTMNVIKFNKINLRK